METGSGLALRPLSIWHSDRWFLVLDTLHVLECPSVMVIRRGMRRDSGSPCKWETFWKYFMAIEMFIAKAGTPMLG